MKSQTFYYTMDHRNAAKSLLERAVITLVQSSGASNPYERYMKYCEGMRYIFTYVEISNIPVPSCISSALSTANTSYQSLLTMLSAYRITEAHLAKVILDLESSLDAARKIDQSMRKMTRINGSSMQAMTDAMNDVEQKRAAAKIAATAKHTLEINCAAALVTAYRDLTEFSRLINPIIAPTFCVAEK